ncbi:zinc finger protein CONSTANS-LIKE 3-like [Aristolochia californica]|uniref:zinc finger protein CONSTANS-LIKE 3-like n=1 Tax=Aristolochia californica TaxID=171875 RepID=UPI0035D59B92
MACLCDGCLAKMHAAEVRQVWMCDVCEWAPATVTCKVDAAALCYACDADIHSANPIDSRHRRLPILPASRHCSARSHTASAMDVNTTHDALSDLLLQRHGAPANFNSTAHNPDTALINDHTHSVSFPSYEGSSSSESRRARRRVDFFPEMRMEREAKILKYREKRIKRKYGKTIRYPARKADAETRPRIGGRFARISDLDIEVEEGSTKKCTMKFGTASRRNCLIRILANLLCGSPIPELLFSISFAGL